MYKLAMHEGNERVQSLGSCADLWPDNLGQRTGRGIDSRKPKELRLSSGWKQDKITTQTTTTKAKGIYTY